MKINLTDEQLEQRLNMVERLIAKADAKDLPALNQTFQRLLDEQVRRDLERNPMTDTNPMDPKKRKALEKAGWKFGDAADFLGMTPEERAKLDATGLYTVPRTGQQPLRFEGTQLASVTGPKLAAHSRGEDRGKYHRWHELGLYQTRGGAYVLHIGYRSTWPGELDHDEARPLDTLAAVAAALQAHDSDLFVEGWPEGDQFNARQERLLRDVKRGYFDAVSKLLALEIFVERID